MNCEVKIGGVYRHFKGFTAKVITVATHTETEESLVVYECRDKNNNFDGIYARPINMFLSKVDRSQYPESTQDYRFELIDDTE